MTRSDLAAGRGDVATRRKAWETRLTCLQQAPLEFCSDFPERCRRWNAWWAFEANRPLLLAEIPKTKEIRWDKAFDLLDRPAEWVRVRRTQMEQTHYAGEALPFVRVDIGPVSMGAYLGAPLHFASAEQTSWQDPIIESWQPPPSLKIDPNNRWLQTVLSLTRALVEDARGSYLVCLPDLTGAIDTLANLRTTERLCFDLFEHRDDVLRAAARAVDAWEEVFVRLYDLILGQGAGITQWLDVWSQGPFTLPTCDFNALIGCKDFEEVCMPSLKEQACRAGRCLFHLDGPDASRHAEILAADTDITAVQFTPGAGTPSALAKLPMLRMLQSHRVPVYLECPAEEVREVAGSLDPRGVALRVWGLKSEEEAAALVAWRDAEFG